MAKCLAVDSQGIWGRLLDAPKIELHIHLEGSLSLSFWKNHDQEVLEELFSFQNSLKKSLPSFLSVFEKIHRALRTPDDYYKASIDLLDQLIAENVRYAEITWAPGGILEFHSVKPSAVFQAIQQAIHERKEQIDAKILVDVIRNQPLKLAFEVANWLVREKPSEVVGINFGGDEERFKITPFVELLKNLKSHGYKLTIHAGESVAEKELLNSVEQVSPNRIGHGTSLQTKEAILKLLERGISVEACPSSNECLGYLNKREKHPIFQFPEIRASVNTDDRSFFSKTLTEEIKELVFRGISFEKIARMQLQAVEDCFSRNKSDHLCYISKFWQENLAVSQNSGY